MIGENSGMLLFYAAGGDRRIGVLELRQRFGFVLAGDEPENMARAVDDGIGERHTAATLIGAGGHGDVDVGDIQDGVAGD